MPATTTGGPFDLNVPSSTNDLADLYGTYLVPNMETINDNAAHKGVAQTFTAAQTFSTTLTVTAGGANIGGDVVVSSGSVTGVTLKAAGLTGATQVSRYVGATTSGAPSTGTFSVGDYVIDQSGAIHVCTTSGSPGTWTAIGNVTYGTPGSSAVGDSAAAGSATTSARSDHRHGREAAGTPGGSAVGDTASAGVATTVARSDHRHSREAFGTTITASTIGGTAAAGTSTSVAREDHKHAFPAGAAPSALTVSSTQATGTSTAPALADHVHAMPGSGTPGASAVGDTASAGTATTVALSDHRHSREAFGTPVNIDASLTSLSAGSLTTVARADHVHTVSKVPVLLASTTTTNATTTSITFSNIPQTYTTLMLYILGYVTNGSDDNAAVDLQFNGDTGANYASMTWSGGNTAVIAGLLHGPANWASTIPAANTVTIHQYRAAYYKYVMAQIMYNSSTTAQNPAGSLNVGGWWKSTAAITSITVKTRGAYYNNGALFSLIGIP